MTKYVLLLLQVLKFPFYWVYVVNISHLRSNAR